MDRPAAHQPFQITGLFQPEGAADAVRRRVIEVEARPDRPQLLLKQVQLQGKTPGVALLYQDRLLALKVQHTLFAEALQLPLGPEALCIPQAEEIRPAEASAAPKDDDRASGEGAPTPEWIVRLAPLWRILEPRIYQVEQIPAADFAPQILRFSGPGHAQLGEVDHAICVLDSKVDSNVDSSTKGTPIFMALDEEVWVQLCGTSDKAAFGILLRADVVLQAPTFVAFQKDRAEREALVANAARPMESSALQDAAFCLCDALRPDRSAYEALLAWVAPAQSEAESKAAELEQTPGVVLLGPIQRTREQQVLHWRLHLLFFGLPLTLSWISAEGDQLDEALLHQQDRLVRAGLRPHTRSVVRAMKDLLPPHEGTSSLQAAQTEQKDPS